MNRTDDRALPTRRAALAVEIRRNAEELEVHRRRGNALAFAYLWNRSLQLRGLVSLQRPERFTEPMEVAAQELAAVLRIEREEVFYARFGELLESLRVLGLVERH